jgi:hypothetical protein
LLHGDRLYRPRVLDGHKKMTSNAESKPRAELAAELGF